MGSGFGPGGSGILAIPLNLEMTKAIRTQAVNTQTLVLMRPFIFVGEVTRVAYALYTYSVGPSVENRGQQQIFLFDVQYLTQGMKIYSNMSSPAAQVEE
jgi:hypothetical protein